MERAEITALSSSQHATQVMSAEIFTYLFLIQISYSGQLFYSLMEICILVISA